MSDYAEQFNIISSRLQAGRSVIHIMADSDPGSGFVSVDGGLEDVYFTTLAKTRSEASSSAINH